MRASLDLRRDAYRPTALTWPLPQSMTFGPGAFTAREAGEVGWVTAAKDGKETLVIRHLKLDAGRRQAQMQLWQKQLAAEANRQAKENRT